MDWPVCKLQACNLALPKKKHFEYETNQTLMTPLYSSLVASTLKNKIHTTFLLRCGTLGSEMFAQGKKQLETRVIIKISTQPY